MSFSSGFFVQLKQVNDLPGGNCVMKEGVLRECARQGGAQLRLLALNLDSEASAFGVRLLSSDSDTVYSHGPISVENGPAEATSLLFELPAVPAYVLGSEVNFALQVLSIPHSESRDESNWQSKAVFAFSTGFRVGYMACGVGYEPDKTAPSQCRRCPAGSVASDNSACTQCPRGTYAYTDSDGVPTECRPCGAFQFSAQAGSTRCMPCYGVNTVVTDVDGNPSPVTGLTTCQQCPSGQYAPVSQDGVVQKPCQVCPEGASCADGVVVAEAGYWIDVDASTGQIGAFRCRPGAQCLSGDQCEQRFDESGTPLPRSCCADGRVPASENSLCDMCLD
ncbi:MAG: hypothetical protein MHM6MM_007950, partial [Cercozoa sp. M6MM]